MKEMTTETGEKHGLVNEVANSVPFTDFAHMDPKTKAKCLDARKRDKEIVKVRYINHRGPNERLSRPYMRWAGDPVQTWNFIPDCVYEVPRGLVEEVNDPNKIPKQRSGLIDTSGKPIMVDKPGRRLHEFVAASI